MINSISHSRIFVPDHEQALDFYVGKLGMEVSADVDLEVMRWLTVNVPGRPEHNILLEKPGGPYMDDETTAVITELIGKGMLGMAILTTDDCRKDYEDLKAKGVEFTEEPTERFYGIDCGFRDPFGNKIRLTEPAEGPIEMPDQVSM
jgi:catechol 2,3-dioxygenase-like lactoylglutathione lyase family enzyme